MNPVRSVTVITASRRTLVYDWPKVSVRIDRRGELHVCQGWRQRAFHPRGEWVSFTVESRHAEPWEAS